VGGTGVVGLLRNGQGATILLRADMDALPMKENSRLPSASTKTGNDPSSGRETGITHSCGHDMHVAWLMGVTQSWLPTRTNGMALWSSPEKGDRLGRPGYGR
jgi:metal-dependent amidase/aminoacylase/carboxypeptidase family protein